PSHRVEKRRRVRGRAPRLELDERHRQGGVMARQAPRGSAQAAASSTSVAEMMDRVVARVLRVQPQRDGQQQIDATTGSWPFEPPLLTAAVPCPLRYALLPFVPPLGGAATGPALGTLLTLDVIAPIAIVATPRRLWRIRPPRRWQYLAVALALAVLVSFFFVK